MLDIIVLAIIGINILVGLRKGFVATILSLVTFVLAILITSWLHPYAAAFMRTTPMHTGIVDWIDSHISIGDSVNELLGATAHNIQYNVIEVLPLPEWFLDMINLEPIIAGIEGINVSGMVDFSGVERQISTHIGEFVTDILSGLILFLVVLFVLRLLAVIANIITYLPIIHSLNKTLGAVAGLVRGLIVVWILLIVYTLFLFNTDTMFYQWYYEANFAVWLNERNLILSLFFDIIG